ncbi:MAG: hypothetical protein AAGJ19_19155 [Myxococcota bacterium]
MDPNATLQRLFDALADDDLTEAKDAATDLAEWLDRGGFTPKLEASDVAHLMKVIAQFVEEAAR